MIDQNVLKLKIADVPFEDKKITGKNFEIIEVTNV